MNGTAVVRESRLRRDGLFGALLAVAAVLVVAWIRLIRRAGHAVRCFLIK